MIHSIHSWGFGCARSGMPGVYAKATAISAWVHQTMNLKVSYDLSNICKIDSKENKLVKYSKVKVAYFNIKMYYYYFKQLPSSIYGQF